MQTPPDRLSVEIGARFYDPHIANQIEVFFNGIRQVKCVMEYCVSEGWIRRRKMTAIGQIVTDEFHQPIIQRFNGEVRVEWKK